MICLIGLTFGFFTLQDIGGAGAKPALPVDSTHWTRALSGAGAARRRGNHGEIRRQDRHENLHGDLDRAWALALALAWAAALARGCGRGRGTEGIPW